MRRELLVVLGKCGEDKKQLIRNQGITFTVSDGKNFDSLIGSIINIEKVMGIVSADGSSMLIGCILIEPLENINTDIFTRIEMLLSEIDITVVQEEEFDLNKIEIPNAISIFKEGGMESFLKGRFEEIARKRGKIEVNLTSFGFSYGIPENLNFMFDARYLTNPSINLGEDGRDPEVAKSILSTPMGNGFVPTVYGFLIRMIISSTGPIKINVGIGCSAGRQRSVVCVEEVFRRFKNTGNVKLTKSHRDIEK